MNTAPNLLPHPILVERSRRRRLGRWGLLVSIEATVLTAACMLARASNVDEVSAPQETIESTVAQIDRVSLALTEAETELRGIRRRIAVVNTVTMRPEWSIVMAVVAREGRDDITLETCQLFPGVNVGGEGRIVYRFTFVGNGSSQAGVTRFVESLKGSGVFDTAQVVETRRAGEKPDDPSVRFTIEASLIEETS